MGAEVPSCLPECFDISSSADSLDTQMADVASCREDATDTGTCNWKSDDIPSLAAGAHVRLTRGVRVRHRTRESVYAEKHGQGIVDERTYQHWEEYLMVYFQTDPVPWPYSKTPFPEGVDCWVTCDGEGYWTPRHIHFVIIRHGIWSERNS